MAEKLVSNVPINSLKCDGKIRSPNLTDKQIRKIKNVFDALRPHLGWAMTLEEWEIGFMHDAHPDREIGCWEDILTDYRLGITKGEKANTAYEKAIKRSVNSDPIIIEYRPVRAK